MDRCERDKGKDGRVSALATSGIFSTKKIFFFDSSRTGSKLSDIPHLESDYCPRDEASRRLFHRRSDACDCDCVADGLWGCLRRNRQCLFRFFIILMSTLIVLFLLASFAYNLMLHGKNVNSTVLTGTKWISHYHNFAPPGEDVIVGYGDEKNVHSEAQDNKIAFYEIQNDLNDVDRYETVDLKDDRKFEKVQPLFIQTLDGSNEDLRNTVVIITDEREPVSPLNAFQSRDKRDVFNGKRYLSNADPLVEADAHTLEIDKETFKANAKTVFEPFSLTMPTKLEDSYESLEYSAEGNELDDGSSKSLPGNDVPPSEASISEETGEEGDESNLVEDDDDGDVADDADDADYSSSDDGLSVEETTTQTTLEETSSGVDENESDFSSSSSNLLVIYSTEEYHPSTSTEDIVTPTGRIEDGGGHHQTQVEKSPIFTGKSNEFEEVLTNWSDKYEPFEAISLAEAIKRRKENRKFMFLNSRVVGGSSDVKLPTAPDVSKPPVSAFESLKTGQQLSFTPSGSSQFLYPYQMCLFANPYAAPKTSVRSAQSRTFPLGTLPPLFPSLNDRLDPMKKLSSEAPTQQNFLTFSINNYANPTARQQPHYPPTGTSLFTFPSQQMTLGNAPMPNTQPIFCTYLQPPLYQFPTVPGTADFAHKKSIDFNEDIFVRPLAEEHFFLPGRMTHCSDDNVSCRDGSACIPIRNWCDNQVHCQDVSDEAFCSCRERVARERICDGYLDCPRGEDEIGCFSCPKSAFSCESVISPEACIPLSSRCDGIRDCAVGNDENDCSALFSHIHANSSYQVSYSSGFLHRNWRGDWFPVCVDVKYDQWAKEACLGEIGYLPSSVEVSFVPVPSYYRGPFIVRNRDGTSSLQDHCKGHLSTYVKCPAINCGTRAQFYNLQDFENRFKRLSEGSASQYRKSPKLVKRGNRDRTKVPEKRKRKRQETGRVVGGRESEPRAWPWAIAIYKDGGFLCGGVILDEEWVLTAAHCMQEYWKHFYEVRGGMLRRFSFSPMEQVRVVAGVIVHENYNPIIMSNDLALLRLQKPFRFNRWVRPGCLPGFKPGISNLFSSPLPGTHCIAVGWGALRERGIDADQLREVEVPILPRCKHKEDVAGAEICAGKVEGGKDTCQGDSGGPLLCKNAQAPFTWYVAGVVSHGEGCARPGEPGAYTRISLYLDWIAVNANDFKMPSVKPLTSCPGFRCTSGSRLCIPAKWVCNGFTDCLEADDEKNCTADIFYNQYLTQMKTGKFPKATEMRITSSSEVINNTNHESYKKGMTTATVKKGSQEDSEFQQQEQQEHDSDTSIAGVEPRGSAAHLRSSGQPDIYTFDIQSAGTDSAVSSPKVRATSLDDLSRRSRWKEGFPAQVRSFTFEDDGYSITGAEQGTQSTPHEISDNEPDYFRCHEIVQSVPKEYHCDGVRDCEDGSDERTCLCADVLKRSEPTLLCDGHQDCPDASDENNCSRCSRHEFLCKISGECLPVSEKCNGVPKCRFGEDERNCFALTKKKKVKLNAEGEPALEVEGFVVQYKDGEWSKLCWEKKSIPEGKVATDVCADSGWIGYDRYENVSLTPDCTGLQVTCSRSLAPSLHHYRLPGGGYLWPWNAFIYSDGTFLCTAALFLPEWLLTSSECLKNVALSKNYLAAKLGSKTAESTENGHQFIRIDAIEFPPTTDVVLLHLSEEINQTRLIRPLDIPYVFESDSERDVCVAVGDSTVFLKILDTCSESSVCYDRMVSKPANCKSKRWIGVIACQSRVGWYPSSPFSQEDGSCGFVKNSFSSIKEKLKPIQSTIGKELTRIPEPECQGFRCPEGRCIPLDKLCDGTPDCPSKWDEDFSRCNLRSEHKECGETELRCYNGLCISKTFFGDGKDDCGDGSDEPDNPNCLEFLRLTAPRKICNGIRNCHDKSDEDPHMCTCDDSKFMCKLSGHCVPVDFVCDGEDDCPGGEDEEKCWGRRNLENFKTKAFEIVKKSYGLWHNTCPTSVVGDVPDALCQDLGFAKASLVSRKNQTVFTPELEPFTWVKLNKLTSIALRSDKPFVRLVKDTRSCYVITCI